MLIIIRYPANWKMVILIIHKFSQQIFLYVTCSSYPALYPVPVSGFWISRILVSGRPDILPNQYPVRPWLIRIICQELRVLLDSAELQGVGGAKRGRSGCCQSIQSHICSQTAGNRGRGGNSSSLHRLPTVFFVFVFCCRVFRYFISTVT
jgi:hypothetical protein